MKQADGRQPLGVGLLSIGRVRNPQQLFTSLIKTGNYSSHRHVWGWLSAFGRHGAKKKTAIP
jgi:hypothetical protein